MSTPYGNDPYGQQPQNPYGGGGGGAPFNAPGAGGFDQPKTDGVSIASLVLSLICCAPVGLILGFVGIKRTKGGQRKGRGLAITGVVLGLLGLLAWVGIGIAAVAGVAWFDSLVTLDEAKAGQCIDVDDDDSDSVLLYEAECTDKHDGEIIAVVKVDDDNIDQIKEQMVGFCQSSVAPEDAAKLSAVEGLEVNAVIEDPDDVSAGDTMVCYVTGDDLDEPIL